MTPKISILFALIIAVSTEARFEPKDDRPESILLSVMDRPFEPTEFVGPECFRDNAIYLHDLYDYIPWALKMYDSSAKITPGLITGNVVQLGNYDECLKVKSLYGFIGQACNIGVQFEIYPDSVKRNASKLDLADLLRNVAIASNSTRWTDGNSVLYEWLWCVPSTCNNTDIRETLEIALDPLKVEGRVDMVVTVHEETCRTEITDMVTYDTVDIIYLTILSIFGVIITLSTGYDLYKLYRPDTSDVKDRKRILLTSFSLYSNGKCLLKTDRHSNSIGCLDGLRYLSICWIIYGHTMYNEVMGVKIDLTGVPRMHRTWSSMLVLNGNIVTDTFFLISGTLLSYTTMTKMTKNSNKGINVLGLYVNRYLRLTPAYAMTIGFYATLFYKIGSGPLWHNWVGSNKEYCRENWWTNLLYVNNYVNVPRMCMSQSWYLAVDMQLFWMAPIFLYPMIKFTRGLLFWTAISFALFLSILFPFVITFYHKLTGTMLYYKEQSDLINVYLEIYIKTYTRFGPYIIGLAVGYVLSKTRSRNIKIPYKYVTLGWIAAIAAGGAVIFGPRGMYDEDHVYNRLEASFYAGFHRQIFALCVSWLIFTCVYGYAGPISKFLSWHGWMPFSKLTYSAYLCHFVFLIGQNGSARAANSLNEFLVVRNYFGNLVLTMILAAVVSLCFEMPFISLNRLIFPRSKQQTRHSRPIQTTIFGSADSEKEICRSTDESVGNSSQAYDADRTKVNGNNVFPADDSTISYCIDVEERERENEKEKDKKENSAMPIRRPSYIYVINSPEYENDRSDEVDWTEKKTNKTSNVVDSGNTNPGFEEELGTNSVEPYRPYSSNVGIETLTRRSLNTDSCLPRKHNRHTNGILKKSSSTENGIHNPSLSKIDPDSAFGTSSSLDRTDRSRSSSDLSNNERDSPNNRRATPNNPRAYHDDDFSRVRSISAFQRIGYGPRRSYSSSIFDHDHDHSVVTRASVYHDANPLEEAQLEPVNDTSHDDEKSNDEVSTEKTEENWESSNAKL